MAARWSSGRARLPLCRVWLESAMGPEMHYVYVKRAVLNYLDPILFFFFGNHYLNIYALHVLV